MADITQKSADHWDSLYASERGATWHINGLVSDYIQRRQFGMPGHWLGHVFERVIVERPKRLLSIGCGAGDHEIAIARNGLVDQVFAFDASPVGVAQANAVAQDEHLNAKFYVDTFEMFVERNFPEPFDMVMFVGSLHHVENLNNMLSKVRDILTPGGKVLYNEYVGPCYISFPDDRVAIINEVLRSIPAEFKVSPDAQWTNPTLEQILQTDPSESVRSALIPQFLRLYFDVEWERGFGGGLLHPLFRMLDTDRLAVLDPGAIAVISMLIGMEEVLEDRGLIPSDFVLGVARHKVGASG